MHASESAPEPPTLFAPQQLYELWERQQWAVHAIDLSRDRRDWRALPSGHRERVLWHIASFFVGEARVTTQLAPLVAAHESVGEMSFLATQQADEARHVQHFDRFYAEVAGVGADVEDRLRGAYEGLGSPLVALLDEHLAAAASRLAGDPGDAAAKVDFVTLYHLVIEGTLALTGQQTLLEFLDRHAILPGWRHGLRLVARDEHRHVAYGVWLLREKAADATLRRRIAEQLDALLPLVADVLVPPGARPERFRPLGWDGHRVRAFALDALARRMRIVGVEVPALSALAPRP